MVISNNNKPKQTTMFSLSLFDFLDPKNKIGQLENPILEKHNTLNPIPAKKYTKSGNLCVGRPLKKCRHRNLECDFFALSKKN